MYEGKAKKTRAGWSPPGRHRRDRGFEFPNPVKRYHPPVWGRKLKRGSGYMKRATPPAEWGRSQGSGGKVRAEYIAYNPRLGGCTKIKPSRRHVKLTDRSEEFGQRAKH